MTRYVCPEVSYVIQNNTSYMDDETWEKLVNVLAPGIRKIVVINVDLFCSILLSIYLTLHLCS